MIIADTSALIALYNSREPAHDSVSRFVAANVEPLVVSPYVVAEIDYLVTTRWGVDAEVAVLRELAGGAYELPDIAPTDVARCVELIDRYRDQGIGIADASMVTLAQRYGTRTILTLDHRHFGMLRPLDGGRFRVVPTRTPSRR